MPIYVIRIFFMSGSARDLKTKPKQFCRRKETKERAKIKFCFQKELTWKIKWRPLVIL